jgi:hypothetical protein
MSSSGCDNGHIAGELTVGTVCSCMEDRQNMIPIAAKVVRIISLHLGIAPAVVVPDASLIDDLGAEPARLIRPYIV